MASHYENEQRWIDAWSELYELVRDRREIKCLLAGERIVDVEERKAWLQNSAYQGWCLKVEPGWVLGKEGIIVSRWRN